MRVRTDTYNAFAEFLGLPDRLDSQAPASGFYLTPADTERLLHDLAVRRPVHANAATALRTAAVASLVADTGRNVPELARLKVSALHLDGEARVEVDDESFALGSATVQILNRWLLARAEIIAELEGSDPGHLWIPTKPGRPRGGRPAVKPGLNRAAVRTLHAAHRTLVSQVLGTPLRPGAFRVSAQARSREGADKRRWPVLAGWLLAPGQVRLPRWQGEDGRLPAQCRGDRPYPGHAVLRCPERGDLWRLSRSGTGDAAHLRLSPRAGPGCQLPHDDPRPARRTVLPAAIHPCLPLASAVTTVPGAGSRRPARCQWRRRQVRTRRRPPSRRPARRSRPWPAPASR